MKTIFLVRHGEKERKPGDIGLTPVGKQQAEITARYFENLPITHLISSPSQRALQTAEIIATKLKKGEKVEVDDRLKERLDFGEFKDQTYQEYLELAKKSTFDRAFILPNGKSSISTGKNITEVINELPDNSNALLISHGGAITDYLRNTFSEEELNEKNPDFVSIYEVELCSITNVKITNKNHILISLDSNEHLSKA